MMPGFYTTILRYYDAENADKDDDLEFYSELAGEYGAPVLEIGSGSGRVLLHLAQQGVEAHGIENDSAMLERAQARLDALPALKPRVRLIAGDVLTVKHAAQYKLVLLSYNALMHFHTQEVQLALLRRLRGWVAPDGLVVFDLPNAGEVFASQDTEAVTLERTFIESETGHLVMQQSVSVLDRAEQLMRVTWIYDEITADGSVKRTFAPIVLRYFFLAELRLLLLHTGFAIEDVYGDIDGSPFEDGCPRMVVLARPV